jgi:hypothetical protein
MKKLLCIAVVPLVLSACASTPGDGASVAAARPAAGGTQFCWKEKLATEGDTLVCNWQASSADACKSTNSSALSRASVVSGPIDARRCENGQWLVQVTTR